jgi:hypothetical protein
MTIFVSDYGHFLYGTNLRNHWLNTVYLPHPLLHALFSSSDLIGAFSLLVVGH